jgi:hypothetical protein
MEGLQIRILADKSEGERITVPVLETVTLRNGESVQVPTGQTKLVNPDTPGVDHEPWPSAGVKLVSAPDECEIPTTTVDRGVQQGWIEMVDERLVRRPAGPADNPTRSWHYFNQCNALIFKTVDGDVTYKVVHQPDKYADFGEDSEPVTDEVYSYGNTRVDWFYGVRKEAQP